MKTNVLAVIDPIVLGMRLARARHALSLTEQQAADFIGVTRPEIVAIEHGERQPRASELVKLATLYRRPVIEFVGDGNQPLARLGRERTQQSVEAAVLSLMAGELTEVEFARWLGIDIVSMRELVEQADSGSLWDLERLEQLRSEHRERLQTLSNFAAGFADLSAEEIEHETARALAEVRAERRTRARK